MRQLLPMAVLLAACTPHAADDLRVDPRAQMGSYLFDDGIRVSGGRFDESGSQMVLYMDTATSRRGSTLKPDGDGFVPAFNFGDVERVTFSDGDDRMQWRMPSGEVLEARRVMRPDFRDVQFENGNVTLRGTLYLPPDAGTPVPAVVLAHGSGPATRHLGTWTTFFVEQGLAVLSYDKRGAGESTGDWQASTYLELAADLSRAVDHIRQLPMIDSGRVGIHTSSQSGWYGPHVARNNPGVAFLIQRVGPAVNIGIGVAHEIREEWRAEGLSEKDIQAGIEFWLELHRLAAADAALAQANTLLENAKDEPWFAQTFGEWKHIEAAWWQRHIANMTLNPADDAAQLDIPVLWFLAENDQNVPYAASHAALQKAIDANPQLELITVEDSPHSFLLERADGKLDYTRSYWPVMSAWLRDRGFIEGEFELQAKDPDIQFRVESQPGQPAIADGVVYLGSEAGTLFAVDMQSGRVLWRFEGGGPILHAPIVAGDLLLFGSRDGRLRAVDKSNGELHWEFEAGHVDWDVRDVFINGTPTVKDGIAYFSSEDFNVYAVEVATGREVWRHTLGEEPQARLIPIFERTAYIGAWDGHLYAIDIDTGERVWRSVTEDSGRASLPSQVPFVTVVPIVSEEAVYFTDWAGNLFAVDRETGRQIWRFDPGAADSRHVGSRSFMAIDGDVLYYSTLEDQHLYGVDRHTGQKVWSTATDGIVYGPASAGNGIGLYAEVLPDVSEPDGTVLLRAMDLSERQVLWTADDLASTPTVVDHIVYYTAKDGTVYGRDLLSGKKVFRLGE